MVTIKPTLAGMCDALRAIAASTQHPTPGQQAAHITYFSTTPKKKRPRAA